MKIKKEMFERWEKYCRLLLAERGLKVEDVSTGVEAWNIAFKLGIASEAYRVDDSVSDKHIATALKKIFPNAIFKDR